MSVAAAEDEREVLATFKLLTYNLFLRPPLVRNTSGFGIYDYKDERLELFKAEAERFDVMCFQELFGYASSRRANFLVWAEENGYPYSVVSPVPTIFSGRLVDGATAIVSRYPIVANDMITFEAGVQSDALAAKGCLYAKILVGNRLRGTLPNVPLTGCAKCCCRCCCIENNTEPRYDAENVVGTDPQGPASKKVDHAVLHLFTTHTQASYSSNDDNTPNEEARRAQCQEIAAFVAAKTADADPSDLVMLCGDMNVDSNPVKDKGKFPSADSQMQPVTEYLEMMQSLVVENRQLKDLLYLRYGYHPVTFGDEAEDGNPKETVLTVEDAQGAKESLDYIFHFEQEAEHEPEQLFLQPVLDTCTVEPFYVEGKSFGQLSDHYGVSVDIQLLQEPEEVEKPLEERPPEDLDQNE